MRAPRRASEVAMEVSGHHKRVANLPCPASVPVAYQVAESSWVITLRVLLLNSSHEPLAVVTGRRALVLVVAGKADCVLERPTGALIRSPSVSFAVPAVVRL